MDTADIVTAPAKETITEPKSPSVTVTVTVLETDVVELPKPQIPPRPVMPPEATAFPRLQKVKVTLDKHNNLIFEAERERTKLEIELSDLKGLARLTKKKELESKIATKTEEIRTLKAGLSGIVRQHGFATVQDFYTAFYTAQHATEAYQKECAKWEEFYGEKATPKPKPCTKSYNDIKKWLTGRMPVNLTEAEIKGRDNRPPNRKNSPIHTQNG